MKAVQKLQADQKTETSKIELRERKIADLQSEIDVLISENIGSREFLRGIENALRYLSEENVPKGSPARSLPVSRTAKLENPGVGKVKNKLREGTDIAKAEAVLLEMGSLSKDALLDAIGMTHADAKNRRRLIGAIDRYANEGRYFFRTHNGTYDAIRRERENDDVARSPEVNGHAPHGLLEETLA